MDQDATWHEGKPRLRPYCVKCGPSSPLKGGTVHHFSAHVCCHQTDQDTWNEGRPRPGHIVLDRDPAPRPKRGTAPAPNFRPMSIVAKRSPISATAEHLFIVGLGVSDSAVIAGEDSCNACLYKVYYYYY